MDLVKGEWFDLYIEAIRGDDDHDVLSMTVSQENLDKLGVNKKAEDIQEIAVISRTITKDDGTTETKVGTNPGEFFLVNTSGKVIDSKSKNKDGNDYQFVVAKGGAILGYYVED